MVICRLAASDEWGHQPWWVLALLLVAELLGGLAVGLLGGWVSRSLLGRIALPAVGLYPLAVLAFMVIAYSGATLLHVSGLLAVYVCALIIGSSRLPHRRSVLGFVEGLAWLAQIGLFVALGVLAQPQRLGAAVLPALAIGAVLLLVARPLAVAVSTTPFRMRMREQAFLSWAGLRGAVPIVFATIPLSHLLPDAQRIFDTTFVLVIVLTVLQGPTLPWVARRLGVASASEAGEVGIETAPLDEMNAELLEVDVVAGSGLVGCYISELVLPRGRGHRVARPWRASPGRRRSATRLEAGGPAAHRGDGGRASGDRAAAARGVATRTAGRLVRRARRSRLTRLATVVRMGQVLESIDDKLAAWMTAQPMFFVATAPLAGDGLVNCSPKGMAGSFVVLDGHRVAYLDLTGSGIETIAHLRENGRIVVMFCAFDGRPNIVRLHGTGRPVLPGDEGFDELVARFPEHPGHPVGDRRRRHADRRLVRVRRPAHGLRRGPGRPRPAQRQEGSRGAGGVPRDPQRREPRRPPGSAALAADEVGDDLGGHADQRETAAGMRGAADQDRGRGRARRWSLGGTPRARRWTTCRRSSRPGRGSRARGRREFA